MAQEQGLTLTHSVSQEQVRRLGQLPCFRHEFQPWLLLMYRTALPAKILAEDRQRWLRREVR